jgi:hypothetical protein
MRKAPLILILFFSAISVEMPALAQSKDCPIEIIKYSLGSNLGTPTLNVQMENRTSRKIDAVKLIAQCYNNFGDPVKDVTGNNLFSGLSQSILHPNKKSRITWPLYQFEGTTKVDVFVSEVHFMDGETWSINSKEKK